MHKAIEKYGWDNFEHIILCTVSTKEEADFLEQWFIEKYDTFNPEHGYNLTKGGGGVCGCTWDEDRRNLRSQMISGEGNPMYGRHHTEECRKRMSEARRGKPVSQEMRQFRTNILLEANKKRQVPIRQIDLDGNVVATYEGFSEATKATGFSHSSICNCCLGKINSAYGFRWEYVDEDRRKAANKRREREDMRRHNEPSNNLCVIQYDLDGNELARFNSISQASRETGTKRSVIADCCHGNHNSYGDYKWKFAGSGRKPDAGLPVRQLDLNGVEVARYDSLDDACERTGFHRSALLNCCKGRSRKSYGFRWEFIGEAPPSNRMSARVGVIQMDEDGNELCRYTSLADAMRATGHDRHRIAECCKGERQAYKGFKWRYCDAKPNDSNQPVCGLFS